MPAREEARLRDLLWRASSVTEKPLTQEEIDQILELDGATEPSRVPQQRQGSDSDSWTRIRTDAGDQRWLNHLSDPPCREPF